MITDSQVELKRLCTELNVTDDFLDGHLPVEALH